MKITKKELKKIIKEEYEKINELEEQVQEGKYDKELEKVYKDVDKNYSHDKFIKDLYGGEEKAVPKIVKKFNKDKIKEAISKVFQENEDTSFEDIFGYDPGTNPHQDELEKKWKEKRSKMSDKEKEKAKYKGEPISHNIHKVYDKDKIKEVISKVLQENEDMLKKLYEEPIEHRYNAEEDHSEDPHKTSFEQLNEEPLEHLTTIDNDNEQKEEDYGSSGRSGTGQLEENEQLQEVAPPGKEKQVKALKKEFPKGSASPFKIAWSKYNKGKK